MNTLSKSLFISLYLTLLVIAAGLSLVGLWREGLFTGWAGVALATWPMVFFFLKLFLTNTARTGANLVGYQAAAWAGTGLTLALGWSGDALAIQLFGSAVVGGVGSTLYVYWYSRFSRQQQAERLKVGSRLPAFELMDDAGNKVVSDEFLGQPTLFIFYRGNWCPLCMAQIKEVAGQYQALANLGVTVALISPQPHDNTRSLAEKFQVPFRFLVDSGNRAARALGIEAENGLPKGLEALGYDSDTVMPTVLITDANGTILFADLTDNYRVRPEPETFIRVLKEHGATG
ncbi:MAG: peroxiredoxin family protein [Marinobacter sp.]|uniref:peroxiredoxin family protein n=1 Tax=Marinobacter sp. TaxID=50741 RepID=UPI00299F3E67|nr:peroxiredoxin family protein [Marinobacter sp.]MDX1756194.1 peroxiredoxin family protein [Marinobacter sp.]